ncbi:MAG: aminotransferase class III-fold pyridoxal phosphate-dependent enzyme, partial [Acidobacteria bacterium]|nr:aminotransferase class III-fold pyridoxal phosphate-dependent enzyme [Acidobacteriota bacterium]
SGTEATMSVIRVARGATGRSKLLKFAGNYHGHSDGLLISGGTAMASLGIPASAGVTASAIADTVVAPYNVVPTLDESFAAVIVEPCAANMGLVPPVPGFLEGLRAECDRVGALLIFDEVITGFRVARGGAQALFGVRPDLTAFGKIIGGGLPVGAFGGRSELMDNLAPLGPVYQAGTLSGNPLATAAGLAALELLDEEAYALIESRADCLAGALANAFAAAGVVAQVPRVATLVGLFFGPEAPVDYETACTTDESMYAAFFHAMLDRDVAIAPGAYEVMFPGLAHDDAILEAIATAAAEAALVVATSAERG